jgi:hypothetical protein
VPAACGEGSCLAFAPLPWGSFLFCVDIPVYFMLCLSGTMKVRILP